VGSKTEAKHQQKRTEAREKQVFGLILKSLAEKEKFVLWEYVAADGSLCTALH
jgi:hypothetical protein